MIFKNKNSSRLNPFDKLYRDENFQNVLKNKDNLPQYPFLVDIELTNCCNLKCLFCAQQAMDRKTGFMSDETFKKVIDECEQNNIPVRFVRWGEPFLHKNIQSFIKYVKSKNLPLHITTNGLVLTDEHIKAVIDNEVDSIIFSFQGVTKEEYELMRNNNQYETLKANILKMVEMRGDKLKPFIHISNTITDEKEEDIKSFIDYLGNVVDSIGLGKTNLSFISLEDIKNIEVAKKIKKLKEKETIKKIQRPCNEIYQRLSINFDGTVSCCCADYNDFLLVGDLNQQSLHSIWNDSNELKFFRSMLDKSKHKSLTLCKNCFDTYEEFHV